MADPETMSSQSIRPAVDRLLADYRSRPESSARVLLVSIFGDAVLPRGQAISVQGVARLVEPFGVSERLVRTSLLRLSRESMVIGEKRGRQSFYQVAPEAVATFVEAADRIYRRADPPWDGRWTIAVVSSSSFDDGPAPSGFARQAQELGLGSIGPGTYVSPTVPSEAVATLADRHGVRLALLTRTTLDSSHTLSQIELAMSAVPLDGLREAHEAYRTTFLPLDELVGHNPDGTGIHPEPQLDPTDAFVVRTLLIDRWRRLALRGIDLPRVLLPADWPAAAGYAMTARLHRSVHRGSEAFLDAVIGEASQGEDQSTARFRFPADD